MFINEKMTGIIWVYKTRWKRRIVANCTRLLILNLNRFRGFESLRFRHVQKNRLYAYFFVHSDKKGCPVPHQANTFSRKNQ